MLFFGAGLATGNFEALRLWTRATGGSRNSAVRPAASTKNCLAMECQRVWIGGEASGEIYLRPLQCVEPVF